MRIEDARIRMHPLFRPQQRSHQGKPQQGMTGNKKGSVPAGATHMSVGLGGSLLQIGKSVLAGFHLIAG
ncbi:MAG TPA: hypothetical protein VF267_01970, partial [Gammaproteobacteria bacterium]